MFLELFWDDDSDREDVIDECSSLKIHNEYPGTSFTKAFEKPKNNLELLEMLCVHFRDESEIISIIKSCQSLKTLNLSGIRVSSSATTSTDSQLPAAIAERPMCHHSKNCHQFNYPFYLLFN